MKKSDGDSLRPRTRQEPVAVSETFNRMGGATHMMSIRLPIDTYETLRRMAYERHQPMATFINAALDRYLREM